MMLAEPIISVLYQHGKFNAYQAAQAAGALRFYAIGLAGYAALKVLVNAFYALDRRKTPMLVSFLAVALNLAAQLDVHVPSGLGASRPGVLDRLHRHLQFSCCLYALMRSHLKGLESRRFAVLLAKVAVATLALVVVCAASSHWLLADWATQAFFGKLSALLGTVFLGAAVFTGCGLLLHIEELKELREAIMRRLRANR